MRKSRLVISGTVIGVMVTGLFIVLALGANNADADLILESAAGAGKSYKNYDFQTLLKHAKAGNAEAQHEVSDMYFHGKGVDKDYKMAMEWVQKAANQGHTKSEATLGWLYFTGKATPKDYVKAFQWCQKAAKKGDAFAQGMVGVMYKLGQGTPQDNGIAFQWFMQAAKNGDALAAYFLCRIYRYGDGVPKNKEEAVKWCRKAANQASLPKSVKEKVKKLLAEMGVKSSETR
jgi:TPR repeat protein